MGIGGIAGGVIVSVKKESRRKTVGIYGSAALFLCTGILGFSDSILSCFNRQIRKLDTVN